MTEIIILRSDFYSPLNPSNTQSNFSTDFETAFDFSNDYECGLVEIIFPLSIKNIPEDVISREINIGFSYNRRKILLKNQIIIESTNYKSSDSLIDEINRKIDTSNTKDITKKNSMTIKNFIGEKNEDLDFKITLPRLKIEYEKCTIVPGNVEYKDKMTKNLEKIRLNLFLSKYLSSMLGFAESQDLSEENTSKYKIDLLANNHSLFIYTNIIEESYVGNRKFQLLRVFPLAHNDGNDKMKSIVFNPIIFHPLRLYKFDSINVQIRDSAGNLVIFENGSVTLTLLIRKKYDQSKKFQFIR